MKRPIDLERAASAETFGALAAGRRCKQAAAKATGSPFTPAQMRALSDLAGSLVRVAREAGARRRRISLGAVTLKLEQDGTEEILSIRKAVAS